MALIAPTSTRVSGISALLRATLPVLQTAIGDTGGKFSGIRDSGMPPPMAGQWYFSLHSTGSLKQQDNDPLSDDRLYSFAVTITRRYGQVPDDRVGQVLYQQGELADQAEFVGDAIHADGGGGNNGVILTAANLILTNANGANNGFMEPPCLGDIVGPTPESPAWVGAKDGANELILTYVVNFSGARRIRIIGS